MEVMYKAVLIFIFLCILSISANIYLIPSKDISVSINGSSLDLCHSKPIKIINGKPEYTDAKLVEIINGSLPEIMFPREPTYASESPPTRGKWIINSTVVIENKSLIINGSIVIVENGSLILRNSELYMNLSYNGEFRIDVFDGGNLTLINSKITAYNPKYNYYIRVFGGAKLRIESSNISHIGYKFGDRGGILIRTSNVTIRNSTIQYGFNGLILEKTSNITLDNIIVADCEISGIYILESSNISITNSILLENKYGAILDGAANITVTDCKFIDNIYHGLYLFKSYHNQIANNSFEDCGIYVYRSSSNFILENRVNGKELIYLENMGNQKIGEAGQIEVVHCQNISIEKSNIINSSVGIEIWECKNITIKHSSTNNNSVMGIFIYGTDNIMIFGSTISSNLYGLIIAFSNNASILSNEISNNAFFGLYIYVSTLAYIHTNSFEKNYYGLLIDASCDVYVFHNNFDNAYQNVVMKNSQRISFYSVWKVEYVYKGKQFFNHIGNYWSNYTGDDKNNDGIGEVSKEDYDSFPLVETIDKYEIILAPEGIVKDWAPKTQIRKVISGRNVTFRIILKEHANVEWLINGTRISYYQDVNLSNITLQLSEGIWNLSVIVLWNNSKVSYAWEIVALGSAWNFYGLLPSALLIVLLIGFAYLLLTRIRKRSATRK